MTPDIIFCHGPFLSGSLLLFPPIPLSSASTVPKLGDYHIAQSLLAQSATVINCAPGAVSSADATQPREEGIVSQGGFRRLAVLVVGLKPHRKLWTNSQRPGESVMYYQLLNGCPAIVLPLQCASSLLSSMALIPHMPTAGAPLVAWLGQTLEQLWKIDLNQVSRVDTSNPATSAGTDSEQDPDGIERTLGGVCGVLCEYLDLCIDYDRLTQVEKSKKWYKRSGERKDDKRATVHRAVASLVVSAIRSRQSQEAQKEIDSRRAGITMWRLP
jgi:hypothetical protein